MTGAVAARDAQDRGAFAPTGMHWLVDAYDVAAPLLADAPALEALLADAAVAAGARVLFRHFHRFGTDHAAAPAGVTGVVLLAESHITIHTWPEHGFAAIDLFLCGAADPQRALDAIARGLGTRRFVTRGAPRGGVG